MTEYIRDLAFFVLEDGPYFSSFEQVLITAGFLDFFLVLFYSLISSYFLFDSKLKLHSICVLSFLFSLWWWVRLPLLAPLLLAVRLQLVLDTPTRRYVTWDYLIYDLSNASE